MKLRKFNKIIVSCLCFVVISAYANEVHLTANQPTKVTFRVAHKNQDGEVVLGELQSVDVNQHVTTTVPVDLSGYDKAGIVIASVNGHEVSATDNKFDQFEQCSVTTDKIKPVGDLDFILSKHEISCHKFR